MVNDIKATSHVPRKSKRLAIFLATTLPLMFFFNNCQNPNMGGVPGSGSTSINQSTGGIAADETLFPGTINANSESNGGPGSANTSDPQTSGSTDYNGHGYSGKLFLSYDVLPIPGSLNPALPERQLDVVTLFDPIVYSEPANPNSVEQVISKGLVSYLSSFDTYYLKFDSSIYFPDGFRMYKDNATYSGQAINYRTPILASCTSSMQSAALAGIAGMDLVIATFLEPNQIELKSIEQKMVSHVIVGSKLDPSKIEYEYGFVNYLQLSGATGSNYLINNFVEINYKFVPAGTRTTGVNYSLAATAKYKGKDVQLTCEVIRNLNRIFPVSQRTSNPRQVF